MNVKFISLGQGMTEYGKSKDVRKSVCLKIEELLADGYEIISVSESFQSGNFDDGPGVFMGVTVYYKDK